MRFGDGGPEVTDDGYLTGLVGEASDDVFVEVVGKGFVRVRRRRRSKHG
jgi:hypothetical protein